MKIVSESNSYSSVYNAYLIDDDGNKYFFKELNNKEIFRELLAHEIATILGLDHVSYRPYILKGKKGVISPSFMKENHKYITGNDLIVDYFEKTRLSNVDYLYDKTIAGEAEYKSGQDLYIVWQAMEARFKNYPNYEEQIKEFMDNLINMITFDLLVVDHDRHSTNWYIEYDDTSFGLCPIFDNNLSFSDSAQSSFGVSQDNLPNNETLKLLLNESDDSVYNKYNNFSTLVNKDNIRTIVDNTIKKYNFPISDGIKNRIIDNFIKNYKKLEEVVNSRKQGELDSPTTK